MNQLNIPENLLDFLAVNNEIPRLIEPIVEEASTRKYYRVSYDKNDLILCEDSNFAISGKNFLEVQKFLSFEGFNVPQIIKVDPEQKRILLSDVGSNDLTSIVDENIFEAKLQDAMGLLFKLQKLTPIQLIHRRSFDYGKFTFEMDYFLNAYQKFQEKFHIDVIFEFEIKNFLDSNNKFLAVYEPKVICHRDFHSRNLLINSEGKISMIDFQDMMMGTPVYDLGSLLYDAYRPISKKIKNLALEYFQDRPIRSKGKFKEIFLHQALQRSFKALGTYLYQFGELGKIKYKDSIFNCLDNLDEIITQGKFPDHLYFFVEKLKKKLIDCEDFNNFSGYPK